MESVKCLESTLENKEGGKKTNKRNNQTLGNKNAFCPRQGGGSLMAVDASTVWQEHEGGFASLALLRNA